MYVQPVDKNKNIALVFIGGDDIFMGIEDNIVSVLHNYIDSSTWTFVHVLHYYKQVLNPNVCRVKDILQVGPNCHIVFQAEIPNRLTLGLINTKNSKNGAIDLEVVLITVGDPYLSRFI